MEVNFIASTPNRPRLEIAANAREVDAALTERESVTVKGFVLHLLVLRQFSWLIVRLAVQLLYFIPERRAVILLRVR